MASKSSVISEDDRNKNQKIHLEKVKYLYDSKFLIKYSIERTKSKNCV